MSMSAKKSAWAALLVGAVAIAQSERIDELFAAVGVEWGATIEEIEELYPGGERRLLNATDANYEVHDARPIFGLDRNGGDLVSFGFIDGGLGNMRIQFPDCVALGTALDERVGPPDIPGTPIGDDQTLLGTWQGSTVMMTATYVVDCILIVTRPLP